MNVFAGWATALKKLVASLVKPSADTSELANAALKGARSIYQPGFQLAKACVMLLYLVPSTFVQGELDWEVPVRDQRDHSKLMRAIDEVNDRFGKRTLLWGGSGLTHGADTWGTRQARKTP